MHLKDFFDSPNDWEGYVTEMARDGTWGDNLTLLAACAVWNCRIIVINSHSDIPTTIEAPPSWDIKVTASLTAAPDSYPD